MKKLIGLFMGSLMVLSLAACTQAKPTISHAPVTPNASTVLASARRANKQLKRMDISVRSTINVDGTGKSSQLTGRIQLSPWLMQLTVRTPTANKQITSARVLMDTTNVYMANQVHPDAWVKLDLKQAALAGQAQLKHQTQATQYLQAVQSIRHQLSLTQSSATDNLNYQGSGKQAQAVAKAFLVSGLGATHQQQFNQLKVKLIKINLSLDHKTHYLTGITYTLTGTLKNAPISQQIYGTYRNINQGPAISIPADIKAKAKPLVLPAQK